MKARSHEFVAVVLALAIGGGASAGDTRQLAASAGLAPSEAAGLSAFEIVELKFNHDARRDDRHPVVIPVAASDPEARVQLAAEAGLSPSEAGAMTLTELAMAKDYRESREQDLYPKIHSGADLDGGAGRAQIVASAHLDPDVARTMTLNQISFAKYSRETD